MSNNKTFFEAPQAAAVYKHKLLKSYIPAWAGKVGSTSNGKRVVVYDAYSGPGRYADNQPGSPEHLVDTAVAMAQLRSVKSIFSEKDKRYCDRLTAMLVEKGVPPETYEVRPGPVEDHIDGVLQDAGNLPLFVFLDPYGLTISFDHVAHVLKSRDKPGHPPALQPKTELLMNFSYEAIRRISGVVRSDNDYKAKPAQIDALNTALGGDWWQKHALDASDGWVNEILTGYANRVAKAVSCGFITADVADSLEAQPVYELILFTRHQDGLWEMIEAMSMARKEWREWLVAAKEQATGGQSEIRGLEFADDESAWVNEIAGNIEQILSVTNGFIVQDKLPELFGRTLGLAREKHIRAALRQLKGRDIILDVPKGSLQKVYIARK